MNALGKTALGLGALAVAGALGYYWFERNTEQPDFRLVLADGVFEVRDYPPLLVAETTKSGARGEALNLGFRELAGYIFAKSRGGEKIAMTAPVIEDRKKIAMTAPVIEDAADDGKWRTRFVMPAKYSRATLPRPPEGVSISEIAARRVAVMKFSGSGNDAALAAREAELRRWMAAKELRSDGEAEYAFYNSPFIPAFMRRNEIIIPLGAGR